MVQFTIRKPRAAARPQPSHELVQAMAKELRVASLVGSVHRDAGAPATATVEVALDEGDDEDVTRVGLQLALRSANLHGQIRKLRGSRAFAVHLTGKTWEQAEEEMRATASVAPAPVGLSVVTREEVGRDA